MSTYLWSLRNFDTGANLCFGAEHLAMQAAEEMVGNNAVARVGNVLLYGPGDGTTSVMIERITRDVALKLGLDGIPPLEGGGL